MSQRPEHAPETQATQFLKAHKVAFSSHLYAYEEHGGTKVSARELNVDEHAVVKTFDLLYLRFASVAPVTRGDCFVPRFFIGASSPGQGAGAFRRGNDNAAVF